MEKGGGVLCVISLMCSQCESLKSCILSMLCLQKWSSEPPGYRFVGEKDVLLDRLLFINYHNDGITKT